MVSSSRLDIRDLLRSLAGQPFYYVPNTGNAGDGLIAYATLQAFRRLSLTWVLVRVPEDAPAVPADSTMVLGGGGHMVRYWNGFATLARTLHGRARRLVILPHTIEGNEGVLAEFGPNVDVVCREHVSYDHVVAHARNGCRVHLSDDMAFHLDVQAALERSTFDWIGSPHMLRRGGARKTLGVLRHAVGQARAGRWMLGPHGPKVLNCFRHDKESAGWEIPRDNLDLSSVFASHDARYGEAEAARSGGALVRYVNRFDVVNTDRLHVAIAGALLGKRVRLHVGSYYKIEAVYRTSMRDRFPNVSLVTDRPA